MSKQHENTPLVNKPCLPSMSEYIQPAVMGIASFANVVGGFFAIASGADHVKGDDGSTRVNPFFYTAMSTSLLYFTANAIEVGRIYQRRQTTWREMIEKESQAPLVSIKIER